MAVKHVASAGAGAGLMALALGIATPQIEQHEGTRLRAYRDIAGVLTVCTGHTGPDVVVGQVKTQAECTALTMQDAEKAASGILKYSPHLIYHPMQLAAAISFTYNVGEAAYARSTVAKLFNAGDFSGGCSAMLKWTYAGGQYSQGLDNRRHKEYNVCTSTLTVAGLINVPK